MGMSRDDNWLANKFGGIAREVTPAAAANDATVWYVPFHTDAETLRRCASILSPSERLTGERFITDAGKNEFIFRRAFRRYCARKVTGSPRGLYEFRFSESENGRPFLSGRPDIWFSFSACPSGFFAAWSLSHAVGVDIETCPQNIDASELAREYFSAREARLVAEYGVTAFLRLWSLKEAALKSIGEGLPFGLDAFDLELSPAARILRAPMDPDLFRAHEITLPDTAAALVTRDRHVRAVTSYSIAAGDGRRH